MKGWISHCENVPSNIGKVLKKSLSGFKKKKILSLKMKIYRFRMLDSINALIARLN